MADGGEGEQRESAEGEDSGDSGGGIFFVGVDGTLGGHDGGDAADGAADGEEAGELGRQLEDAAEKRHDCKRENQLDGDEDKRHAADVEDVSEDELGTDEDDAELEPELIGGYAGAEDCGNFKEVRKDEAEDDGPEDVLDVREGNVVRGAEVGGETFQQLAGDADGEKQRSAGQQG